MVTYREALQDSRLATIERALELLRSGRGRHLEAASVIAVETGLGSEFWEDLADALMNCGCLEMTSGDAPNAIEGAMTQIFDGWLLQGGSIPARSRIFGRLREFERMVQTVVELGFSDTQAEEILWGLCRSEDDAFAKTLPTLRLGGKIVWSTYCEQHIDCADPFDPCPDAQQLPYQLGLTWPGKIANPPRYMVLAYQLPATLSLHFPTIADAFLFGFGNVRFRPGGRTLPTVIESGEERGRPECVHEGVTGESIVRRPGGLPIPGWP